MRSSSVLHLISLIKYTYNVYYIISMDNRNQRTWEVHNYLKNFQDNFYFWKSENYIY